MKGSQLFPESYFPNIWGEFQGMCLFLSQNKFDHSMQWPALPQILRVPQRICASSEPEPQKPLLMWDKPLPAWSQEEIALSGFCADGREGSHSKNAWAQSIIITSDTMLTLQCSYQPERVLTLASSTHPKTVLSGIQTFLVLYLISSLRVLFSAGGSFTSLPSIHLARSEDVFGCYSWEWGLLMELNS